MKVLFFSYPVAFVTPGGGEMQLLETRRALQDLGVQVDLFNQWEPNIEQYDIIHTFSVQAGVYQLHHLAKQRGIRVANSPIMWIPKGAAKYDMHNLYHVMASADVVLPNSIAEKQAFLDFYDLPVEKYHVAYNGIDPADLKPVSSELFCKQFGLEDKSYLLCVANIEHRKNQYRLIEAVNQLNMKLVLMGHVRDQAYFDECKKIMKDNVQYIGALPHHSDLFKSAFAGAKAHVLPGLLETPGLASIEAAALGVKVVSTDVGCAREYFEDIAEYCDPHSIESIAQAITRVLSKNNQTEKLRTHVLTKFTWENTAKQTIAAYEKILRVSA